MKDHVLVTCYTPAVGPVVMHAYGPWTRDKAARERRKALNSVARQGLADRFTAKACRMLDVTG
jgi:hypothetical protein